jgi:predicted MPP superfamily phosphohydrolase
MKGKGAILFFLFFILLWLSFNAYFYFRVSILPLFSSKAIKIPLLVAVCFLTLSYILGRILIHKGFGGVASFLEIAGAIWIGVVFIFIVLILIADILTLFGYFKEPSIYARYFAVVLSSLLSIFALYQGLRTPVIREEKINVEKKEVQGLKIVQISDLHLGTIIGTKFLTKVVKEVNSLEPDLVLVTGDLIDSGKVGADGFSEILKTIKARYGVCGVLGNHEFYLGEKVSEKFFEQSGITLLRNRNVQIKDDLIVAGIDDLTAKRHIKKDGDYIKESLSERKDGYLILMSHSPLQIKEASEEGVDLMLSGHTHNGQIWPFNYFSKMAYPYNYGKFKIDKMTLIVTGGAGSWGPPMRLFRPGEIVLIKLV